MTDNNLDYAKLQQPYSSGSTDEFIDVLHPVRTSAQLADSAHDINVRDKFKGRGVFDSTLGQMVYASGTAAADAWLVGSKLAVEAGEGITDGSGTIIRTGVQRIGGIIRTSILIDLTDLSSATTVLDIIGVGTEPAYLGRITAAVNGTILGGRMTCLEAPLSLTDIDLYSADEATGVFEALVTSLTQTALITAAGAWTLGEVQEMTALPTADEYLYLANGVADTADVFTAGRFLIELEGYDA